MACLIKSKDNSTKGILYCLEVSHIVLIHAIEQGVAVVNLTAIH